MMRRKTSSLRISETEVRRLVVIHSDLCEAGTIEAVNEQFYLLGQVANVRDLTCCGARPFDKFSMKHDGQRWVLEAEAIELDPLPDR